MKKETPIEKTSSVVGKWQITESNVQYSSFEFTVDNKYLIAQENVPVSGKTRFSTGSDATVQPAIIFGDYSTLGDNENNVVNLNLSKFGTITATVSDDGQSMNINVNGTDYKATKVDEMPSNDKTELLCHTWKFQKGEIIDENLVPDEEKEWFISEYGSNWKAKVNEEFTASIQNVTITFTKAGTYFIYSPNDPDDNTIYNWEWEDISKGIMTYTAYYEDGEIYVGRGTVIELTDKQLKFQEDYILGTLSR